MVSHFWILGWARAHRCGTMCASRVPDSAGPHDLGAHGPGGGTDPGVCIEVPSATCPAGVPTMYITIPVVSCILCYRTGGGRLISDRAGAVSGSDVLNEDFRRLNADAVDTHPLSERGCQTPKIQFFCPRYHAGPLGSPTNGITRTQTTKTSFSASMPTMSSTPRRAAGDALAYRPVPQYLGMSVGGSVLETLRSFRSGGPAATDGVS